MGAWIAAHRKAIAGAVSALGGILAFIAAHQEWGTVAQYAAIAVAILGAAGVYRVPNAPAAAPAPAPPSNVTIPPP